MGSIARGMGAQSVAREVQNQEDPRLKEDLTLLRHDRKVYILIKGVVGWKMAVGGHSGFVSRCVPVLVKRNVMLHPCCLLGGALTTCLIKM